MSSIQLVTLVVLWTAALGSAENGLHESLGAKACDRCAESGIALKRFAVETAEEKNAKTFYEEARILHAEAKEKVKKMPDLLPANEEVEHARYFARKANESIRRHSKATEKGTLSVNAYNGAVTQMYLVKNNTKNAQNLLKVADEEMRNVKKYFNGDGTPKEEKKAKSEVSKPFNTFLKIKEFVDKANDAAKKIKEFAKDTERYAVEASVVSFSAVAKDGVEATQDHVSRAENAVANATSTKKRIDDLVRKMYNDQWVLVKESVEAADRAMAKANKKLTEVKEAAEQAEANNSKVEDYVTEFNDGSEKKRSELDVLDENIEWDSIFVSESERRCRQALNDVLAAAKALDDAAAVVMAGKDNAAAPMFLCGALSASVAVIASVVLF